MPTQLLALIAFSIFSKPLGFSRVINRDFRSFPSCGVKFHAGGLSALPIPQPMSRLSVLLISSFGIMHNPVKAVPCHMPSLLLQFFPTRLLYLIPHNFIWGTTPIFVYPKKEATLSNRYESFIFESAQIFLSGHSGLHLQRGKVLA